MEVSMNGNVSGVLKNGFQMTDCDCYAALSALRKAIEELIKSFLVCISVWNRKMMLM